MFGGGRLVADGARVVMSDDSFVDEAVARYLRMDLPRLLHIDDEETEALPPSWRDLEQEAGKENEDDHGVDRHYGI